jgi:Zn-finger protein
MWTRLNHQCKHFKNLNSIYNNLNTNEFGCTLYGIANCLLFDYTTTSNGKEIYMCLKCYIERDAPTIVKYVVFQSPTYMKALLS